MPGVCRPFTCLVLSLFALVVFHSSAFSQTVVASLAKSSSETNVNITLTPSAVCTGFAANKAGTVTFKVFSLDNANAQRTVYENAQQHAVTTDAQGNVTVPGTAITKHMDFFLAEELVPLLPTTSWATAVSKYNARAFKVEVTVTINGVTRMAAGQSAVVMD